MRRIPISLIRSETEMYIIFITPTPAITSEMAAIAEINKVKLFNKEPISLMVSLTLYS